jgi:capsular exopolysaccharide synthesis family protein
MKQQEFDLAKQLKGLWRFKWIIIVFVLVAGGTAWGFTSMQPPVYEATATVMVESIQPKMSLPAGLEITYLQDIGSQIEVMKSRSVLERAVSQLEREKATNPQYLQLEADKLRDALKIQQVRGTNLVALTVVSFDPIGAQKQANAVAEAYVYEARRIRLTAIETALENTTKQLKQLGAGKVDISISPSLTRLTAQIDTALVALEAASERLQQIGSQDAVASPELNTIILQRVGAATSEANKISALAQELKFEPIDIAVIESRTRALAIKLEALSAQVEEMRRAEIDPQVYSELLDVEELVRVANATVKAILEQVIALYEQTNTSQLNQNLRYRIVQHTDLLATALKAASEHLQHVATLTRWQEVLNERAASATATLQALSQQLRPLAPGGGVLLTHDELAAMETRARTVTATVSSLLSEVEGMRLDELNPQVYAELQSVKELVKVANDAARELPDEIAGLAEGGGGSLSYAALDNLRQELQLALLTSDSSGSGTRVVDMAAVSSPATDIFGRYKNVILAVVAALLLGILSALVLQYFDRRVRDASQVTSYVGLPLLASVGITTASGNPHLPSVLNGGDSQYLEAFRMLRANLGLDSYRGRVLLVSSPEEKEGKTTVAANLARVVALQGRRVLLIDGNLRKPDVAAAFSLAEAEGLSEFMTRENEPWDYVTEAEGVDIIPSGAAWKSAEMLSLPRMKALLEKARHTYDVVIVDSAPVMGCADTRILAKEVDEALLVLQPDVSRLDLAKDSRQALETMGVRVVGFVLNKVRGQRT